MNCVFIFLVNELFSTKLDKFSENNQVLSVDTPLSLASGCSQAKRNEIGCFGQKEHRNLSNTVVTLPEALYLVLG